MPRSIAPLRWIGICLLVVHAFACVAEGPGDDAAAAPDVPSQVAYEADLKSALDRWDAQDGFATTLIRDADVPEVSVFKTPDAADDGTEGIAPIIRARLIGGTRVLVIGRSDTDRRMWKITNGRTVGWVSQMMLERTPETQAMPDAVAVGRGAPALRNLAEFEETEFCRTFVCRRTDEWLLKDGGTNYTYELDVATGFSIEVQAAAGRFLGAGLSLYERPKDATGRTVFQPHDLAIVEAFIRTVAGAECNAASLLRRNFTRDYEQIMQAPVLKCGNLEVRAGQVLNPVLSIDKLQ